MYQNSLDSKKADQPVPIDITNVRKLFLLMHGNWYWFVISLVLAGTVAFFYNKYTLPDYHVGSSVLIELGEGPTVSGLGNNMLEGFGLGQSLQNLDNQTLILTSWTLIGKTLEELPFNSDIYRKGLWKKVSYFPLNPIRLIPDSGGAPENVEFTFQYYQENVFRLFYSDDKGIEKDTFLIFGQDIDLLGGSFTVLPQIEMFDLYESEEKIYFVFHNRESLIDNYRRRLVVTTASRDGTILNLSLEGPDRTKDIVFLDKHTEVYMRNNLERKNHEASRIIEFIDEQLIDVSDSLIVTENQLQEFRSKHRIMDVSAQAQQIIDQAVVYENEKARLKLEANYYEYLDEYLSSNTNQEVPISPATMGIEDPLIGNLMQELSSLQSEYFSGDVGERNPMQSQLELRIKNTKESIKETLNGIQRANKMAVEENNQNIRKLNSQASGLPVKERQLLGFERKFNLNNVLYTFLLQQRAEAQIQKASNRPDNELIDPARAEVNPIAPSPSISYSIAFLLGIGIPFLFFFFRNSVNTKLSSEDELKAVTNLPIVGYIPHSRLNYNTVVLAEPQSVIADSFRSLRTRMEFFTREVKSPVILISSSMPSDGKTFTTINLASAYSLAEKKTVVVGFDLRRPTLNTSFNIGEKIGLSSYLIGKNSLDDIIIESEYPNLHIITTGPIPPNPGELATTDKTRELFVELRKRYDFILVDSAPLGVVADNYPVASIADATIILVRHGYTKARYLESFLKEAKGYGLEGLSLLVNDLKTNRSSHKYSRSYKFGKDYR